MADATTSVLNQLPNLAKNHAAAFRAAMDLHAKSFHERQLPAEVIEYDRTTNVATVKPMIAMIDQNNVISRNQIADLPVFTLGGGGFMCQAPLKQGDLGWILASDRDITLFLESLTESKPNSTRAHDFGDSWFVPDVFRNYTLNEADANSLVLQKTDGTTRITISDGEIQIIAPTDVKITTPLAIFSENVQIGGDLVVTGNTQVNGGFDATGTPDEGEVNLPAQTKVGSIVIATHGHISSASGTRTGNMIT